MKVCYFTATGNCLYVAKRIGGDALSMPQLMKQDKIELSDDAVGIVCPVYAGEMPKMVRLFMDKANIRTDYFFFIYTYGMNHSAAIPNAVTAAAESGTALQYVNSIKMVDNYLPGFEMKNQIETAPAKKIEEQIDGVSRDIAARRNNVPPVGIVQKIFMGVIHNTMAKLLLKGSAAQQYIVNTNCIRCGICAKVCPANNITVTDQVHFSDHCESCYACLHACPKNALHMKNERSTARFRNEHVTLKEIITANERQ
ncbi:MAG: EFR1 family ferrodoxin [Clostridia bacterium]|nr:EFR1 family ferrodoxin [Clostridia bacterium]